MNYKDLPYPIKYAVEPIYHQSKNQSIPLGYIVTKAFLIRETRNYTMKGESIQYQVVYPIKGYSTFKHDKNIRIPQYNQYGYYTNTDYCENVFNTYEEAKKKCNELNGNLFLNYYPYQPMNDRMQMFQDFEYEVMEVTSALNEVDMSIRKK